MDRKEKYEAYKKKDILYNRGRLINSCEELKYLLDNPKAAEIIAQHSLNDILTYATTFSKFYKPYNGFSNLQDFPIINKEVMKKNWEEIIVNEYADCTDNKIKYTSGSTGTPFKIVMDRYKHCRWIAGNKVFRDNVGVPSHTRTVYISGTVEDKKIPKERMEEDNVFYLDCKYFDENTMHELIEYLEKNKINTMTATASFLDGLARFIQSGNANKWKGKFIAVFSVSETLKKTTRKVISDFFDCPVYVLYANEENGVLAVEDGTPWGCRANNVDFFFEVLEMDSDKPAKDGEVGRLVITDFYNKVVPIIRYENGDLVSKVTLDDGRVYIKEIMGRKVDTLYTTDGKMVHYFNSISFLEPFLDIKQFQLIQYDYHNFKWILNTENHSYEDYIVTECKKLFGKDSNWKFEYVKEIPKLRSGKFRMTVCLIEKE
ncbi:MAG: hypothetical protein IJZ00_03375 [Lachnospiraceae bacterium]|nr:hypothetical protein [Lachnospiraceae bacterium]